MVCYLTLPEGAGPKNLPIVLNVHGGPWARDRWELDPEAQWLANRGYAVLQVNYRGSTGFGKQFVNAANREWGGRMHDDLIDAVNRMVDDGIADPEKVAILRMVVRRLCGAGRDDVHAGCFRGGGGGVGISNLVSWYHSIPPYWSRCASRSTCGWATRTPRSSSCSAARRCSG